MLSTSASSNGSSEPQELPSLTPQQATEFLQLLNRSKAPTDVFRYGEYVFGYEPAAHHREMVQFCLEGIEKRINSVDLEPRGAAKTTWVTTILLSWLIAKNPDLRVGLFSKTAERAFDMSRGIRLTLERNERFKEVFGHLVSDTKWTDAAWLRAGSRWEGSKDVTLFAGGVGGQVVSKRFDILLLDDVIDDENSATTDQRERINQWMWKTAYPCLSADGVVLDIGTRWAEDDIHQVLIDPKPKGKGWRHRVEGALTLDGGEYRSYWPEVWPVDKLMGYKENMGGPMFACAYLNDISAMMEGNVFQKSWLQWFDTDPALADRHGYLLMPDGDYTHRMGVDLAMSTRERADFTARVTLAENRRGDFFVLAAQRDKMEGGHAAFVNSGYQAFPQISAVKVESVQAQSLLVQELMRDYPRIPVVPKKTVAPVTKFLPLIVINAVVALP